MTISSAYAIDQYAGNDVTMSFDIHFPFFGDDEIEVILTDDATGVETAQVLNTDYSVDGGGVDIPDEGSITFLLTAPATGETVTIRRATDRLQELDLTRGGALAPNSVEGALDRAIMLGQEDEDNFRRTLHVPPSDDPSLDMELPSEVDRASTYLGFDDAGEPIPLAAPTGTSLTTPFSETLLQDDSAAAARATLETQEDVITARGDIVRGDASGDAEALSIGAAREVLTSDGADADWAEVPFPRGFISGLVTSNDDPPLGDDINVTAGACRDSTDTRNMILTAEITKQTDAIWDTGDDAGGMPNGLLAASTWYRVFLIMNPTTGDVEVGFDTSATAANLIVDHSGSGGGDASGYTLYRQIGWILTNATPHVYDFIQTEDQFHWQKAQGIPNSASQVSVSVAGDTPSLVTIMCPPLHWARIHATGVNGLGANNEIWITAVSPTSWEFADEAEPLDVECFVYPNASSQIRTVGDDTVPSDDYDFSVDVLYFIYRRGKDD